MPIAVKVVSIGKGGGASELAKYISERERHPEREGKARELFGQDIDGLKDKSASRHLTRGESNEAQKKDIFHLVISPEAKEFERAGKTNADRKEVYKEATRSTMQRLEKEVGATELRWVAAIHLNTKTPHIHVLIHKDYLTPDGEPRRFHRVPNLDTKKTAPETLFHNQFAQELDFAIEKGRVRQQEDWKENWKYPEPRISYEPKLEDREKQEILGKALLAKETISPRDLDKHKFEIKVNGFTQTTSEAELTNSIKERATQVALWTRLKVGVPGLERLTKQIDQQSDRISKVIQKIDETTNAPFIKFERYLDTKEGEIVAALQASRPIQAYYNAKESLEDWYTAQSEPIYLALEKKKQEFLESVHSLGRPEVKEAYQTIRKASEIEEKYPDLGAVLEKEKINELQETYVRHFDTEGIKRLEEVRVTSAYLDKQEIRTPEELARLEGQHTVMEAQLLLQSTPEQRETLKVLTTILDTERERFAERGIRVTPEFTPNEREFVDRVATITQSQHLLDRVTVSQGEQTAHQVEMRQAIASGLDLSRAEEVPTTPVVEAKAPALAEIPEIER